MFTVNWYRYPNGIEGESMKSNSKEFENIDKAIEFLNKKYARIKGIYWAGGYIENEKFKTVYEITSDSEVNSFE